MKSIPQIAIELFGNNQPCKCGGGHEVCLKCQVCRASEPDELYNPAKGVASVVDATVLKATTGTKDVLDLCAVANEHHTASVCINSYYIPLVKVKLEPGIKCCTVINFPLGSSSAAVIEAETLAVLKAGAEEVDMVQNLNALMSEDMPEALLSIALAAKACIGHGALLKVILETCYLTEEQIIVSCLLAKKAGAKFVKTSTGFGTGGATVEAIALMHRVVGPKLGVKASGGIKTREQALQLLEAGASRIGASNVIALL